MVERRNNINFRRPVSELPSAPIGVLSYPDRADTYADPFADLATLSKNIDRRAFIFRQTRSLNEARNGLVDLMMTKPKVTAQDWREVYDWLTQARYEDALQQGTGQFGTNLSWDPELIRTPIAHELPNHDVIGDTGWLREGAVWDAETRMWKGGKETPSSRIILQARDWAQNRFGHEAPQSDTLQNYVELPNGDIVKGNFIVRGETMVARGRARIAERGEIAEKFYTNPNNMIVVTGEESDRERIFASAISEIADQQPKRGTLDMWANISYLLFQAPIMKRGSDAVIRSFIAIAGAYMLEHPPRIPQDCDLRAYVVGQKAYIDYVIAQNAA